MIKYSLRCVEDHRFDSWFASAEAYDKLVKAGRLTCAVCGSPHVEKMPMAPSVSAGQVSAAKDEAPSAAALRALRDKIERESEYVGPKFASEARAIHEGDSAKRAVHGEATGAEVKKLIEDGVPVAPLPFVPRRKSH